MTTETPRAPVRISAKQNIWRYKSRAGTYEECMALYVTDLERDLRECVELLEMVCSCYSVERHNSGGSGPTERTVCKMCLRKDALLARLKEKP